MSNRLPVAIAKGPRGFKVRPAAGGLASALWPVHEERGGVWVGWPGKLPEDEGEARSLLASLRRKRLRPVSLDNDLIESYYHGFSNSVLWPTFHYFLHLAVLDSSWWDAYLRVNQMFARTVARLWQPGDTIWVHDYHLLLLPGLLRQHLRRARIGFFLHTPFPSSEVFRSLPWRQELLRGMLGADLVGFHTYGYLRHFRAAAARVLGVDAESERLTFDGRPVRLGTFPVGVEARRFWHTALHDEDAKAELESLRRELQDRRLILGVDRMDYTKGIPERLLGYERFLENNPKLHGRVELIQIGVPTRGRVGDYQKLRRRVEEIVGHTNGRFATTTWTPVKYIYRPVPFPRLCAFYRHAAVGLVTPLRDGMNLVAKEYLAAKMHGGDGMLVLSEFAGAASDLTDAVLVNPNDVNDIAAGIQRALTMPRSERRVRLRSLLARVAYGEAHPWGKRFLGALAQIPEGAVIYPPRFEGGPRKDLLAAWQAAASRMLLLDYDGTLRAIVARPELARPDRSLRQLLTALARLPGTEVVVVSGRDRKTLAQWLRGLNLTLVAEHGRWIRSPLGMWTDLLGGKAPPWLERVENLMSELTAATPGSHVERKSASVVWHYRGASRELGELRARELVERLQELHEEPPIDMVLGKKAIEARVRGISKAGALITLLSEKPPTDLLFAAGDDQTDEDMFAQLPPSAWSVHVGSSSSRARFSLKDVAALRALLQDLKNAPRETED